MAVAMGGRIAEELIFGEDDITTGAGGDFQQVTRTARMMIEQMGFSEKLGQVAWGGGGGGPSFLGASAGQASEFSQQTADAIDSEVRQHCTLLHACNMSTSSSLNST
jgi:cell division protease FtsH